MKNLTALETRAHISRACNNAMSAGADALTIAMLLDSVKADLLMQVPYTALAELQEENENKQQEENADV